MELNNIYNIDCTEGLKKIKDNSIDCVITSPPYNMRLRIRNGQYTLKEKSESFSKKYKYYSDDLPIDDFYYFHKKVLKELLKKSKIIFYNFQIVTGSKEAFFRLIGDFAKNIKDVIIWDKGNGQPAMHEKVLNSCYEFILVLESDFKCGRVIGASKFKRGTLNNIWKIKREINKYSEHGAVFPKNLTNMILENFTKKGDIILDPFMGLGTTAVSCKELERKYIGFEISEEYCNIANKRIKKINNKKITQWF